MIEFSPNPIILVLILDNIQNKTYSITFMDKRAKSRLEIADEYGISAKTLSRWLQRENIQIKNGLVTPKEQELIYSAFGKPDKKEGNQR